MVKELRRMVEKLSPKPAMSHSHPNVFIQPELKNCTYVFVRNDAVRTPFHPTFDGPFEVLNKYEKYFTIRIKQRTANISIDKLKAAFMMEQPTNLLKDRGDVAKKDLPPENEQSSKLVITTRSGRKVKLAARYQ